MRLSLGPKMFLALMPGLILATPLVAEEGQRDPEFLKAPVSQWLLNGPQATMRWSERVLPVTLSLHQRLVARLQIQLDGAEAARRRGEGQLIFFFQLTDAAGRTFQDHSSYNLHKVEEGLKSSDLLCTDAAFVVPGDYSVVMAIYDTATREHSIKKDKLHVAPLKADPLPDAGRDLPSVEFIQALKPPDTWFAPGVQGKLRVPLAPHCPVQIEALVNVTPSEIGSRSYGVQDRNLRLLLPTLKVISQMAGGQLPLQVSLVDLARRRVTFRQEDAAELDWDRMKKSLSESISGSIDVKSLADRQHNAAFFVSQVAQSMKPDRTAPAPAPRKIVIVMSGPMAFDAEQDLDGVKLNRPPGSDLFYLRLQPPPPPVRWSPQRRRRTWGLAPVPPGTSEQSVLAPRIDFDQLEPMMKPLEPRLFEVAGADQFRQALATIMGSINKL